MIFDIFFQDDSQWQRVHVRIIEERATTMKTRGASNADTDLRLSPWELLKPDNFTP